MRWRIFLGEIKKDKKKKKRSNYIGIILIDSGLTLISTGMPLITNGTKVVKYSKVVHSVCAASWRAAHNVA